MGPKENIEGQSNEKLDNLVIFKNSEIEIINKTKFNIHGNIEDKNRTLNEEEELEFPLIDIKDQRNKNISCFSAHQDKENYNHKIDCNPDKSIKVNMNRAIGYFNNTNKSIIVLLSDENKGLIDIFNPPPIHYYSSDNSLPKGVIAGIFISCGLALIISLIIAYSCRKQRLDQHTRVLKDQNDTNTFNNLNLSNNN